MNNRLGALRTEYPSANILPVKDYIVCNIDPSKDIVYSDIGLDERHELVPFTMDNSSVEDDLLEFTYILQRQLKGIVEFAYGDDLLLCTTKFKRFIIFCSGKKLKSKLGDCRFKLPGTSHIRIFHVGSRDYIDILITAIHEVSHHIDLCLRGKSGHDKVFYDIYQKLLWAAINMDIISFEDATDLVRAVKSCSRGRPKLARMLLAHKKKLLGQKRLRFDEWKQMCLTYMDEHNLICAKIPSNYRTPNGHYPGRWVKRMLARFDCLSDAQRIDLLLALHICPNTSTGPLQANIDLTSLDKDLPQSLIVTQTEPFFFQYSWPTTIETFTGVLVGRHMKNRVLYCYFRSLNGEDQYILPVYPHRQTGAYVPKTGTISFADDVITGMVFSCSVTYSKNGLVQLANANYLGFCFSCQFWNLFFEEYLQSHVEKLSFVKKQQDFWAEVNTRKSLFAKTVEQLVFQPMDLDFITREQLANLLTICDESYLIKLFNVPPRKFEQRRRDLRLLFSWGKRREWISISIPLEDLIASIQFNHSQGNDTYENRSE